MSQETELKPLSPGGRGLLSAWARPWKTIGNVLATVLAVTLPKLAVLAVLGAPFLVIGSAFEPALTTTTDTTIAAMEVTTAMFDLMPVVGLVLLVGMVLVMMPVIRGPRI